MLGLAGRARVKQKKRYRIVTVKKEDSNAPKVDMENLYGSWKYAKITSEDVTKAVAKMNKDHEKEKVSRKNLNSPKSID